MESESFEGHVIGTTPLGPVLRCEELDDELILLEGSGQVAVSRHCPHRGADLGEGRILGNAIKCPLHGCMFRLSDGKSPQCPAYVIRVYGSEPAPQAAPTTYVLIPSKGHSGADVAAQASA